MTASAAARASTTPPSTTTSRSPCTAHSASIPADRADPAYLVEGVGLAAGRPARAEHDRDVAAAGPAQRAGPGEQRLVGLGAQHRVDDQGLEPGVPGAAHLGGAGVDLGGGERDLAGVAEHGGADLGGVGGVEQLVDVRLDDLDGEPDQVDGLLEVDHAGQGARCDAEDRGHHLGAARGGPVAGLAVPVDEPADAGLHDHADPGAVLGAQVAEPRHVLLHPGHRGRAQRAGRPLEGVGGPLVGRPRLGHARTLVERSESAQNPS